MDYDRIILELLNRISVLEDKVNVLERNMPPAKKNTAPVGKKYRYLSDFLYNSNKDSVELTFDEIEGIINEKLPDSAHRHREFWSNTESHSIAISWMSVGYKTVKVDILNQYVVFEKKREY